MSRVVVNEIEAKVGNDITFNDTVKIDTIKGKTTAGSVTVQGEGTNTTNLQQGLGKAWQISTDAAVLEDSLNIASGTDNGTGDYTFAFTNNISSVNYSHPHSAAIVNCAAWSHTRASSSMRIGVFYDEGGYRNSRTHGTVHGDLA